MSASLGEMTFLADENMDPAVVAYLRGCGWRVSSVHDVGLRGATDQAIFEFAAAAGMVIITHDADFGALAMANMRPFIGILFLRPAHFDARFTIETINVLRRTDPRATPPFVLVARRSGDSVVVRVREIVASPAQSSEPPDSLREP